MPIDTKIEGDPESIRGAARWLRGTLSAGIYDCTTAVYSARTTSESEWTGAAGEAFRTRITGGARKADELSTNADSVGVSFDSFADDLHTAQIRMDRARQIALDGGLTVVDQQIQEPGPAPADPGTLAADATPEERTAHGAAVQAQEAHAAQQAAYQAASTEASGAREDYNAAVDLARRVWSDLTGKAVLNAADFATGVAGALTGAHAAALRGTATALAQHGQTLSARYVATGAATRSADVARWLAQRGMGSADDLAGGTSPASLRALAAERARILDDLAGNHSATNTAQLAANRASRLPNLLNRTVRGIPVIGLGITAAGIGYDIHTGKPPAKAIVSGLAGFGASVAVGAAIGGPVGVVAGIGVGLVTSGLADMAWEALPDSVTGPIDDGVAAVGGAIADGADAVADGARRVWDSIF